MHISKNRIKCWTSVGKIVSDIPAPTGDENEPLQALIFDSIYDNYQGAIAYCRIKNGTVKVGDTIKLMATGKKFVVTEVGYFEPGTYNPAEKLTAGRSWIYRG